MILDHNRFAFVHGAATVRLPRTAFRMMRRLAAAKGNVVHWESLIASIWDNPDREPENAMRCILVTLHRVRRGAANAGMPDPVITFRGVGLALNVAAFRRVPIDTLAVDRAAYLASLKSLLADPAVPEADKVEEVQTVIAAVSQMMVLAECARR